MCAGDIFKKFAVNIGVGAAIQVIRGWLNGQLKDVQPSDLYEAITTDGDLWSVIPDDIKATGHKFKNAYRGLFDKFEGQITTELVLTWIKEDHPQLYSTIINIPKNYGEQAGILWMDKQVRKIKQQIIEM